MQIILLLFLTLCVRKLLTDLFYRSCSLILSYHGLYFLMAQLCTYPSNLGSLSSYCHCSPYIYFGALILYFSAGLYWYWNCLEALGLQIIRMPMFNFKFQIQTVIQIRFLCIHSHEPLTEGLNSWQFLTFSSFVLRSGVLRASKVSSHDLRRQSWRFKTRAHWCGITQDMWS